MNQEIENTKYENLDCKLEIGIWTENENEKIEGDEDENMKPKWTFLFLFIKNFQCKGNLFPPTPHPRFRQIFDFFHASSTHDHNLTIKMIARKRWNFLILKLK